jgi:hypothetical protein
MDTDIKSSMGGPAGVNTNGSFRFLKNHTAKT